MNPASDLDLNCWRDEIRKTGTGAGLVLRPIDVWMLISGLESDKEEEEEEEEEGEEEGHTDRDSLEYKQWRDKRNARQRLRYKNYQEYRVSVLIRGKWF